MHAVVSVILQEIFITNRHQEKLRVEQITRIVLVVLQIYHELN